MLKEAPSICVVGEKALAGTSHIPQLSSIATFYRPNEEFQLIHDYANPYDPWAVEVWDSSHRRIGYISCEVNEYVARLLDGGKSVSACLCGVDNTTSWTRLLVEVYLHD